MGDGDEAYKLFNMLNPINHTRSPQDLERYKVEPYVVVADIYSHPQHVGRGGWTWYTGSASWLYRVAVEYILGLKLHGDHFTLEPCIPSHWPNYALSFRHGETTYGISVENDHGGTCRVESVVLDGQTVQSGKVPLLKDGQKHEVRVTLAAGGRIVSATDSR
jgi:cyclic beta-1,2-glucan synthetase